MKKIIFIGLFLITKVWALPTTTVTVAWDASPSVDVSGYRLYFSTASGSYVATNSINVGNALTYTLTRNTVVPGTKLYFVVTAYTAIGLESDFSNEISMIIPLPPITLHMTAQALQVTSFEGARVQLQSTPDFKAWTNLAIVGSPTNPTVNYPIDHSKKAEFYRASYATEIPKPGIKSERRAVKPTMPPPLPPLPPGIHFSFMQKLKLFLRYRPGMHPHDHHGAEDLMRREK